MLWSRNNNGQAGSDQLAPTGAGEGDKGSHFVSGHPLNGSVPDHFQAIYFGMGCFWGAERLFWPLAGVYVTAVGYQGGTGQNPTYQQVCAGNTGHAETVKIVFDPRIVPLARLLGLFWEQHDPTQGNRQGNDVGSQYRSAIFTTSAEQVAEVEASRTNYANALGKRGLGDITTQIAAAPPFYFAEEYHQQYLAKNPGGYCGLKGTGVSCPIPA